MVKILFQDKQTVVCLKPPGIVSQDAAGPCLPTALREQLRCEIYPVHRLDRDAAGIMACAKTQRAAAALSEAIRQGKFLKTYLCLTQGVPEGREGVYRDLLVHDKIRNKTFVVDRPRGGAKEAVLSYRVLDAKDSFSLVEVHLVTGRTHQIRAQFAAKGTPLLGDAKYGGRPGSLALWSAALSFPSPAGGKILSFHAEPAGGPWEIFDKERFSE